LLTGAHGVPACNMKSSLPNKAPTERNSIAQGEGEAATLGTSRDDTSPEGAA
jgi:hypothetical protein